MFIARVLGNVVSTLKNPHYRQRKILVIQPLDPEGVPRGTSCVAVDTAQAGVGDLVLAMREGGGSRISVRDDAAPVHSVIVGVIDSLHVRGPR